MNEILNLLEKDGRLTASEIAVMLGKSEDEVKTAIAEYEEKGVVL